MIQNAKRKNEILSADTEMTVEGFPIALKDSNEGQIDKLKQALGNIEWSYEKLFKDLNGFVESHEKKTEILEFREQESHHLKIELGRLQKKIDMLMQKLHTSSSSIHNIRTNYKLRMQEVESIRKELSKKTFVEAEQRKKLEDKYKQLHVNFREKTKELGNARAHAISLSKQIENLKIVIQEQRKKQEDTSKEKVIFSKIKQVVSERDGLKGSNEQLQASLTSHKEQLSGLRESLSILKIEKSKLEASLLEQEKRIVSLSEANKIYENKSANIVKKNESLEQEFRRVKEKFENLTQDRQALISRVKFFEDEVKDLSDASHGKSIQISQLNAEVENYKRISSEYNGLVIRFEAKEENEKRLESDVAQLEIQLSVAKTEIENKNKLIQSYQSDIESLRSKEESLIRSFNEKEQTVQSKLEHLHEQKEELQHVNFSLKEEIGFLKNTIDDHKEMVKLSEQKYKNTIETSLKDQEELKRLSEAVKTLEDKNQQLLIQINKTLDSFEKSKEREEALRATVEGLNQNLINSEQEKIKLKEEVSLSEEKISTLNAKHDEVLTQLQTNEESLSKLEASFSQEKSHLENILASERKKFENQLEQHHKSIADIKRESEIANGKVQARIRQVEGLEAENQSLQQQVNKLVDDLKKSEEAKDQVTAEKFFAIEKHSSLDSRFVEITQKLSVFEEDNKNLRSDLLQSKGLSELLKQKVKTMSSEMELYKSSETDLMQSQKALQSVLSEKTGLLQKTEEENLLLVKQIEDLSLRLNESEEARSKLASERYFDTEQLKNISTSLNEAVERANTAKALAVKTEDSLKIEKKRNTELHNKIEVLVSELAETESVLAQIEENRSLDTDRYDSVRDKLHESQLLIQELEERKSVLENNLNQERELNEDLQKQLDNTKVALESLQNMELDFLETEQELKSQNHNLIKQNQDLRSKVEMIEEEIQTKKDHYAKTIADYESRLGEQNTRIEESSAKIDDLERRIQSLSDEHQKRVEELENKLKFAGEVEKKGIAALEKREEKLSYYSRWVDIQKQNLQGHVLTLAKEMKASLEVNPLKAYLKITEKEISNLKIAMSKIPHFDPNKAQYEEQYEQLIHQRDEVAEALQNLSLDIEKRVESLKDMLKSSEFVPTPPLPPGK